jgi:hypothetical protein
MYSLNCIPTKTLPAKIDLFVDANCYTKYSSTKE